MLPGLEAAACLAETTMIHFTPAPLTGCPREPRATSPAELPCWTVFRVLVCMLLIGGCEGDDDVRVAGGSDAGLDGASDHLEGTDRDAAQDGSRSRLPDAANGVAISIDDMQWAEGDSGHTLAWFHIALGTAMSRDLTLTLRTEDGSALAGEDYLAAERTLTIEAGSADAFFFVSLIADEQREPDESFSLSLVAATGGSIAPVAPAVGTIVNDDDRLRYSVYPSPAIEGDETLNIEIEPRDVHEPAVLRYETRDATATAGADYETVRGELSIAAGERSYFISIPLLDDDEVEGSERLELLLSEEGQAEPLVFGAVLLDDETAPSWRIISDPTLSYRVPEAAGVFEYVLLVSPPSHEPITIEYSTVDGSAAQPADYLESSGTLTIPAGQSSASIQLSIVSDEQVEDEESFELTATSLSKMAHVGTLHPVTIIDDDGAGAQTIEDVEARAREGDANLSFEVTLSRPASRALTLSFATQDGTAVAGSDYTETSGSLSVAAGGERATINVPIIDDAQAEQPEALDLQVSVLLDEVELATTTVSGHLFDDDGGAYLDVGDAQSVVESDTHLSFTVTLSGALAPR